MLFLVLFLLSESVQVYEIFLLLRCFFKQCKFSWKGELLSYIALYIVMSAPYLLINIPLLTLVCSLVSGILITFIYEGSWKRRILSGVFVYVIFTIAECVVAPLTGYMNLDILESSEYHSSFATVCLPVVGYLLVHIVKNFKNIQEGEHVEIPYWIISCLLPVLLLILFVIEYQQKTVSVVQLICFSAILFAILIFVFYLYDHQIENFRIRREMDRLELQNQYQMEQIKIMNRAVEVNQQQKHDFLKHISMIAYLNEQKENEPLKKYLCEIQENSNGKKEYIVSGNLVLDGIINVKLQELVLSGAVVDIDVKVPEDKEFSAYDMNVLFSNLLDNCREAIETSQEKKVLLKIMYNNNQLLIQISNTYEQPRKCFRGEYVTTKTDKENHGYGLKNVKEIVEKYSGRIKILDENGVFTVKISLYFL